MFNLSATRIISYWWKALPVVASRFSCDVMQLFCGPIFQEESRRQKRLIAPARVVRERYNDSFWPETISMDGFVRGKWTSRPGYPYKGWLLQFARKTKARFTNLIENEIVPPCLPPPPSPFWGASKHNSVFLLSFQTTSFPGSLILPPWASEERPWLGLVTCPPESGR